jgi:hypothetical protein
MMGGPTAGEKTAIFSAGVIMMPDNRGISTGAVGSTVGADGRRVGSNNGRLSITSRHAKTVGGAATLVSSKFGVCGAMTADRRVWTSSGRVAK